jgi:hypothetical protein
MYEFRVRPHGEEGNYGKIVAIDRETGAFAVDASEVAACNRLEARFPDTQIWPRRDVQQLSTPLSSPLASKSNRWRTTR